MCVSSGVLKQTRISSSRDHINIFLKPLLEQWWQEWLELLVIPLLPLHQHWCTLLDVYLYQMDMLQQMVMQLNDTRHPLHDTFGTDFFVIFFLDLFHLPIWLLVKKFCGKFREEVRKKRQEIFSEVWFTIQVVILFSFKFVYKRFLIRM